MVVALSRLSTEMQTLTKRLKYLLITVCCQVDSDLWWPYWDSQSIKWRFSGIAQFAQSYTRCSSINHTEWKFELLMTGFKPAAPIQWTTSVHFITHRGGFFPRPTLSFLSLLMWIPCERGLNSLVKGLWRRKTSESKIKRLWKKGLFSLMRVDSPVSSGFWNSHPRRHCSGILKSSSGSWEDFRWLKWMAFMR